MRESSFLEQTRPPRIPEDHRRAGSGQDTLVCWRGMVISSPDPPPTGGCATRVLVEMDGGEVICTVYHGPHRRSFTATAAMPGDT